MKNIINFKEISEELPTDIFLVEHEGFTYTENIDNDTYSVYRSVDNKLVYTYNLNKDIIAHTNVLLLADTKLLIEYIIFTFIDAKSITL